MNRTPWLLLLGLAACPPAPEAPAASPYDRCLGGDNAACHALAEDYLSGKRPAPSRRRVGRLYEGVCGTRYPADPNACMAAALYARACDTGDGGACAAVAELVATERVDGPAPAGALYARACQAGHAPSCARLGAAKDPATLREGCDGGAGAACFALGRAHATGQLALDQTEARHFFERGCTLHEGRACAALAELEVRGIGGAVKRRAATTHFREACTAGIAPACLTLARHVEHGELGLKADPAAAFDLYRRARSLTEAACADRDASACSLFGVLLREGSGGPTDTKRGRRLQTEACLAGDADGCRRAAVGPSGRFDPAQVPKGAAEALAKACATDGDACLFLAVTGGEADLAGSCARGHGPSCTAVGLSPVDPDKLQRACDLGDANGCHHLALVKAHVEQELEVALELFRDACRWGSGAACTQVGILRLRGEGMRLDPMAATSAFVQACRLGDATGCAELGWLRLSGQGKKDVDEGVAKLTGACRQGEAEACARLGLAQLRGQHGLDRDPAAGKTLLREACTRGSERACLDLADAVDPKEPALVVEAATRGRKRCQRALRLCGEAEAWTQIWVVTRERAEPRVSPPPRCGGELERLCNDAREATAAHCAAEASACWTAATFGRRLTSMGASVTTAEAQEKQAVAWARGACAKGEAQGCAVLAEAHRSGRGVRQDDAAADRFLAKACKADPGYCP